MKTSYLDKLKSEFIGLEFNWLTVVDVVRENGIAFVCKCKCGNIKKIAKKYVISGKTKSCGCYKSSDDYRNAEIKRLENSDQYDKVSKSLKEYYSNPFNRRKQSDAVINAHKNNPDLGKQISISLQEWAKSNPDRVREIYTKRKITLSNNPDIQTSISIKNASHYERLRRNIDFSEILSIVHTDYTESLINGQIRAKDIILMKCPICGEYAEHRLGSLFIFYKQELKCGRALFCKSCECRFWSSKYESEIADFISTFYSGKCIKNSRDIISPQELDLYYPEKKIAIEFNGDYWHSEKFKDRDYHYNKFITCCKNNILLVSIFESEWHSKGTEIKNYIKDLFNGIENSLSFNDDRLIMNNNYPTPVYGIPKYYVPYHYIFGNLRVYTCGFSCYKE